MSGITIHGLTKRFDDTIAVDGVSLNIDSGELFFLLGPSGCGKTTLLRMIAGFIDPTAGSIHFDDRDVTALPPHRRNTGMVFQSYALWPHMTVFENVAYGLNVRKVAAAAKRERVRMALRSVHMEALADRKPNQLSGGQQQRIALARALAVEPSVLLLDEPLSNLDARLRIEMRSEIRRICKAARITGVYVTHDQKEALSMADRIAVLRDGRVAQVGPPRDVYERPRTRFVADFLGETNFISGVVEGAHEDVWSVRTAAGILHSQQSGEPAGKRDVTCSVRPEAWRFGPCETAGCASMRGRIIASMYLGEVAQHTVQLPGEVRVRVLEMNPRRTRTADEEIELSVHEADVVMLED